MLKTIFWVLIGLSAVSLILAVTLLLKDKIWVVIKELRGMARYESSKAERKALKKRKKEMEAAPQPQPYYPPIDTAGTVVLEAREYRGGTVAIGDKPEAAAEPAKAPEPAMNAVRGGTSDMFGEQAAPRSAVQKPQSAANGTRDMFQGGATEGLSSFDMRPPAAAPRPAAPAPARSAAEAPDEGGVTEGLSSFDMHAPAYAAPRPAPTPPAQNVMPDSDEGGVTEGLSAFKLSAPAAAAAREAAPNTGWNASSNLNRPAASFSGWQSAPSNLNDMRESYAEAATLGLHPSAAAPRPITSDFRVIERIMLVSAKEVI